MISDEKKNAMLDRPDFLTDKKTHVIHIKYLSSAYMDVSNPYMPSEPSVTDSLFPFSTTEKIQTLSINENLFEFLTVSKPFPEYVGPHFYFIYHHQKLRTLEQRIITRFTTHFLLNGIYIAVPRGECRAHINTTIGRVKHDDIFG